MNLQDAISKVEAVLKLKKFEIMRGDLEVEEVKKYFLEGVC